MDTFYPANDVIYISAGSDRSCDVSFRDGGEWDLEKVNVSASTDAEAKRNFSYACLAVTVRRRPVYYVINLFLPTIIICVLSTFGLFASVDADQNEIDFASLGQTTLLSLAVLLLTVADQTPKGSPEISLLGKLSLTQPLEK